MFGRYISRHDFRPSLSTITSVSGISSGYRSIDGANISTAADGTADYERSETATEKRQRWFSLVIAYIVVFLTSVQSTMYWTSLWPFLDQVDPSAGENFYGYVIMVDSLATAVACPILGWWANQSHDTKWPIVVGLVMSSLGNALLAFIESFPTNRKWIMLASRIIAGSGRGNIGALYAYIVMASKESERNTVISIRAAVYSVAQIVGPGIQAAFVPIGYPGFERGELRLNMYTTPAIVAAVLGILQVPVLLCLFKEYWISVPREIPSNGNRNQLRIPYYDYVAVITCIALRFTVAFCWAYDDVIQAPFSMVMFGWNPSQTVLYNGLLTTGLAVFDMAGNLLVGAYILNHVSERIIILFGLSTYMIAYFVIISWPGLPPLIQDYEGAYNASDRPSVIVSGGNNSCDYTWCSSTTKATLAQYVISQTLIVVAVVTAVAPTGTLFSKVIGPRKQGTLQGIFAASQQLAYSVSPVVCGNMFEFVGPNAVWIVGIVVTAASIIATGLTFNRLLPWSARVEKAEAKPLLDQTVSL